MFLILLLLDDSWWLIHLIPEQWRGHLYSLCNKIEFYNLSQWLKYEYKHKEIFPSQKDIFECLKYTSPRLMYLSALDDLVYISPAQPRVVILAQDPYYDTHEVMNVVFCNATGLALSVHIEHPIPPSLNNIFIELSRDRNVNFKMPDHGSLIDWAKQGVILLNSILSVEKGRPDSHSERGWEEFTDGIISCIDKECDNVVFMLWGARAKAKESLINNKKHLILMTSQEDLWV